MITPTGAAIISTLTKSFRKRPLMKIEKIGYGAGEKEFTIPNLLRVSIGEKIAKDEDFKDDYIRDEAVLIETNIDDMNPEFYDYIVEKLFSQGVLDVFLTPIQMKKNRPAHMLSIIVYEQNLKEILEVLFSESTSLGIRIREISMAKLRLRSVCLKGKLKILPPNMKIVRR